MLPLITLLATPAPDEAADASASEARVHPEPKVVDVLASHPICIRCGYGKYSDPDSPFCVSCKEVPEESVLAQSVGERLYRSYVFIRKKYLKRESMEWENLSEGVREMWTAAAASFLWGERELDCPRVERARDQKSDE